MRRGCSIEGEEEGGEEGRARGLLYNIGCQCGSAALHASNNSPTQIEIGCQLGLNVDVELLSPASRRLSSMLHAGASVGIPWPSEEGEELSENLIDL